MAKRTISAEKTGGEITRRMITVANDLLDMGEVSLATKIADAIAADDLVLIAKVNNEVRAWAA